MGWQWHQLKYMQIICTTLQTDNPITQSFTGRMLFLTPNCQSTEGNGACYKYSNKSCWQKRTLIIQCVCANFRTIAFPFILILKGSLPFSFPLLHGHDYRLSFSWQFHRTHGNSWEGELLTLIEKSQNQLQITASNMANTEQHYKEQSEMKHTLPNINAYPFVLVRVSVAFNRRLWHAFLWQCGVVLNITKRRNFLSSLISHLNDCHYSHFCLTGLLFQSFSLWDSALCHVSQQSTSGNDGCKFLWAIYVPPHRKWSKIIRNDYTVCPQKSEPPKHFAITTVNLHRFK